MYSKDYIFTTKLTPKPTSYEKVAQHPAWKEVIKQEYESIMKNESWTLVNLSSRKVPITMKLMYKTKTTIDGSMEKLKTCLVAQGFEQ
jgi:hypothetical protein